jgi:polyketide biosynthesis enoyl-CoA hydratase PksH
MGTMSYETIEVCIEESICSIRFARPDAQNAINGVMIREWRDALNRCKENRTTVVVIEGTAQVFCPGADLKAAGDPQQQDADALYDVWLDIATGPFISIAHVQGKASAGGMGFVAASNIVIASDTATFALPEQLFGLMPACVLPFLARRVGAARADYLALSTLPISAEQACSWGLVDVMGPRSDLILRKHLGRLRHLQHDSIARYKSYASTFATALQEARAPAVATSKAMFSDPATMERLRRYALTGRFPWEE